MLLGLLSGLSVAFAATPTINGSCGTGVNYTYSQGKLLIHGSGRMADYSLSGAPWNAYAAEISSVEIAEGVQNIGAAAFAGLTSCKTYIIPYTVTQIGQHAFVFNVAMTTISLPGVQIVGPGAFIGCDALVDASYPPMANIASGNDILIKANALSATTPSIPPESQLLVSGVDRGIRWRVYAEGTMVISPEYDGLKTYIPEYSSYAHSTPWSSYTSYVRTLILTDDITSVGAYAFANMHTLSEVLIGSNVTSIGACAFIGCTKLQKIQFSGSLLRTVAEYAFYNCNALSEVVSSLTPYQIAVSSGNDTLIRAMVDTNAPSSDTPSYGLIEGTGISWSVSQGLLTVSSAKGKEAIPNFAAKPAPWSAHAARITSLQLSGITQIGYYAFSGLSNLTSVNLGTTATIIQSYAFRGADKLQTLALPASLRIIQAHAFADAAPLTITTPNPEVLMDISYEGHDLTVHCNYVGGTPGVVTPPPEEPTPPTSIATGQIAGTGINWILSTDNTLIVTSTAGAEAIPSYAGTPAPWSAYAQQIMALKLNGITQIGYYAFAGMPQLASVDFGETTTEILPFAFRGAVSLQTLVLPASLRTIHASAFEGSAPIIATTPNLQVVMSVSTEGHNLTIQYGLSSGSGTQPDDGDTALSGKCGIDVYYKYDDQSHTLTIFGTGEIEAHEESKNYPWFSFAYDIHTIRIQEGVTAIPPRAFYRAGELTTITIPGTVVSIGDYAFYLSSKLHTAVIDNVMGAVRIGSLGNTYLTKVVIYTNNGGGTPSIDPGDINNAGVIPNTSISWSYNTYTGELSVRSSSSKGESIPNYSDYNSSLKTGHATNLAPWAHLAPLVKKLSLQNITEIGMYAFSDMRNLTTISFVGTTYSIGSFAFARDVALANLVFPNTLVIIENNAFSQCSKSTIATTPLLEEGTITIGSNNNITIIQEEDASIAKEGYIRGTNIYWSFDKSTGTLSLQATVNHEAIPNYASGAATPWSAYRDHVTKIVMRDITCIGQYAFADLPYVREVVYAEITREVAAYAFANCQSLMQQTLPASLTAIHTQAFARCNSITTYTPNSQSLMADASGAENLTFVYDNAGSNPTPPPEPDPGEDPEQPATKTVTLTIEYYYKNGQVAAPAVTIEDLPGKTVRVPSPALEFYSTADTVVERTLHENETYVVVYEPERYSLTLYYVDHTGNEIAPPTTFFLHYGEEFKRDGADILPVIEGYRADREVIDLGSIKGPIEPITIHYAPLEYTVSVVQVDLSGHRLSDTVYIFPVLHGNDMEIDLSALPKIDHYELCTDNVSTVINVTADTSVSIVYQKKAYTLTVEHVDTDGNTIAPSTTLTAYYGEPIHYELPSLQAQGFLPVQPTLTLTTYSGEQTLQAHYSRISFTLQVQLVEYTADGQRLLESHLFDIAYGQEFSYTAPEIKGYTASTRSIDLGVVTAQPLNPMIIEYSPQPRDLTIQLLDSEGNFIGTQVIKNINVGASYKLTLDPVDGYITEGILIEGIMGMQETDAVVEVVLQKRPASGPDLNSDPLPEPQPDGIPSTMLIILICGIAGIALGAVVTVLFMRKRKKE